MSKIFWDISGIINLYPWVFDALDVGVACLASQTYCLKKPIKLLHPGYVVWRIIYLTQHWVKQ